MLSDIQHQEVKDLTNESIGELLDLVGSIDDRMQRLLARYVARILIKAVEMAWEIHG